MESQRRGVTIAISALAAVVLVASVIAWRGCNRTPPKPSIAELAADLANPTNPVEVRRRAAMELGSLPAGSGQVHAIQALIFAVRYDGDREVRLRCLDSIRRMGIIARPVVPFLDELRKDERDPVVVAAIEYTIHELGGRDVQGPAQAVGPDYYRPGALEPRKSRPQANPSGP